MRVLITNDDGVHGHGLRALFDQLQPIAECTILVPDRPRSACSHAVTLHKPLRVEEVAFGDNATALICNGTPSDCVALGLEEIMQERPDLVISGINHGPNLGDDISYSGTVSAAMEAAIFGVKAFAISVCGSAGVDFSYSAGLARSVALEMINSDLPAETFLNINVPDLPADKIEGIELTRQGRRRWTGQFHRRDDVRGGVYYWRGGEPKDALEIPGTDVWAIAHNRVSITPLRMQWTDERAVETVRGILDALPPEPQ